MIKPVLFILVGLVAGWGLSQLLSDADQSDTFSAEEKQPLYWVAPMDPNYRRNKPGKSPMGMDLVPVYEEAASQGGPGTVKISPDVINNLGVRTTLAVKRALHSEIQTVGYVQYNEDQLVHIHPRVEGWIETMHVKAEGDPVNQNQPLYSLYSPQLVNAQEELVLALNRNNKKLIRAAEERLLALQMSQQFIENVKRTKEVKQTVTFYTSREGVVDNLNVREGFFVKPGTTLMSIGSLADVWVEAEIFESQVAMVNVGQPVTMTLGYLPGKIWRGKVDYVYPTLDPQTRTLRVRLTFNNHDNSLKPNMFAQVTIHIDSDSPRLVVPSEAVIRTANENRVVLNLGNGEFKSVHVALGQVTPAYIEIVSGLSEGDSVVTSAQFLLDSESSVNSDFKRMHYDELGNAFEIEFAVVDGLIKELNLKERFVTIHHQPIPKWQRPEMEMDFVVADSVDMSVFHVGQHMNITFEIRNGEFVIVHAQPIYSPAAKLSESLLAKAMERKE